MRHPRHGIVLLVVLVIVALASMVAASLLFRVHAEVSASQAGSQGQQAYAAAMSGVQRAITVLQTPGEDWNDNPALLGNQFVYDDGANMWYFTVYAGSDDHATIRNGLDDEAGKININTADAKTLKAMLTRIPATAGVSVDDLVNNLMTYSGRNGPSGQGQDSATQPAAPYTIKGGPLATLEEALLVQGFTGPIVYGEDANLNGILDPNEDDGNASFPPDNSDGVLDRGLMGLATVVSHEQNIDSGKRAKININGDQNELNKLNSAGLGDATVNFIKTYRAEGNLFVHPSQLLNMEYQPKTSATADGANDNNGSGGNGNQSSQPGAGNTALIKSGVTVDKLATVLDRLTTVSGGKSGQLFGLINVNSASPAVLACLSGMDDDSAKAICDARTSLDDSKKTTPAWLVSENLLPAEKFKEVAPYLTARSFQYRIRCVGYGVPCGRYRVIEAVVDLAGAQPRLAYLRDVTGLGLPMALTGDPQQTQMQTKAK